MVGVVIRAFGGISPKTPPRRLSETQAQTADKCAVFNGALRPAKDVSGTTVSSKPLSTQTIYKFGQDSTSETSGWLAWSSDVDVARGQINGDTEEWTFYTGDGAPKAIRSGYTASPISMGIAAPSTALTAIADADTLPADTDSLTEETRLYTYTFVYKIGGRDIESAPAPGSNLVDIYPGQSANLHGFATPTLATHYRIYRSTAGVYLFVAEISLATGAAATSTSPYEDDKDPELLAEELPSLYWAEPPTNLAGLINMPNGVMAGFVGRDVYFCEPYVPHAWPEKYRQALDYPVVGLGRMDTTLAVLTKGTPYFIQGSHPDSVVVVKSDLEQACSSKRSIVSFNNSVFYCSPDGLIALTPSGSRNITDSMFTKEQWQDLVDPTSVIADHYESRYVGFYNNGTDSGSFIFDTISNSFVLSTSTSNPTATFQSLRNDKLYVAVAGNIKEWDAGSNLTYTWRSKIFPMARPVSMSCAQIEAEAYPVTAKIYADDTLLHTQTVADRNPFRLPVKVARDWEVELSGTNEVFTFAMAQSMEELKSV
jgi:hypothetical protein